MNKTVLKFFYLMIIMFCGCKEDEVIDIKVSVEDFIASVEENPINGLFIGNVQASTNRGTLTYSIIEDIPQGAISLNSSNGELTVLDSTLFDFEKNETLTAKIKVENSDVSDDALIIIKLSDVETSVSIDDQTFTVEENPANGQMLGNIKAKVVEGTKEYELVSVPHEGAVSLNSVTGELSVADSSIFDFEFNPVISIVVKVSSGQISKNANVTLKLIDIVNSISTADFTTTIDENPSTGDVLGYFDGSTNEGDVIFSIVSQTPENAISVDESSGEIVVNDALLFDFETNPVIEADVKVSSGDVSENAKITINLNDVMDETISFTQLTVSGGYFAPRQNHQILEFEDKLWVIGGFDGSFEERNDVWSSTNGTSWNNTSEAGSKFPVRLTLQAAAFEDKLWVIAGEPSHDDVWYSSDGTNWVEASIIGPHFSARADHQVVVFNNQLWLIGGYDVVGGNLANDIWSSPDGKNWTLVNSSAGFSGRIGHQSVVMNNKLWVIGGYDGSYDNEVWSSTDGVNWVKESIVGSHFSERSGHEVVVFNNKLWVIGGFNTTDSYMNDIWTSSDGVNWTKEEVDGLYFSKRYHHQATVFKNELYIIGGANGSRFNDIWKMD